jgi:hypothetical protein
LTCLSELRIIHGVILFFFTFLVPCCDVKFDIVLTPICFVRFRVLFALFVFIYVYKLVSNTMFISEMVFVFIVLHSIKKNQYEYEKNYFVFVYLFFVLVFFFFVFVFFFFFLIRNTMSNFDFYASESKPNSEELFR